MCFVCNDPQDRYDAIDQAITRVETVADKLSALADDIYEDIKRARADGDDERRQYHRGELYGIQQALDIVERGLED